MIHDSNSAALFSTYGSKNLPLFSGKKGAEQALKENEKLTQNEIMERYRNK